MRAYANRRHSDATLLATLRPATSLGDVSRALQMSRGSLAKRCTAGELAVEYQACAARGLKKSKRGGMPGRGLMSMTEEELDRLELEMAAQ